MHIEKLSFLIIPLFILKNFDQKSLSIYFLIDRCRDSNPGRGPGNLATPATGPGFENVNPGYRGRVLKMSNPAAGAPKSAGAQANRGPNRSLLMKMTS